MPPTLKPGFAALAAAATLLGPPATAAARAHIPALAVTADRVAALRDRALADSTAWSLLESLTTEVGARPVGSPAMIRARDWAVQALTRLGFENVHIEPFTTQAWLRGEESAAIVGPYPQPLHILGLGNSTPTPREGLEAPIVVFSSFQNLIDQPRDALRGKIAFVNEPMVRTQTIAGYAAINPARSHGPQEAAARGAVGYLVRSLSTTNARFAHAGAALSAGIPAAALAPPDADLIQHMADRGTPVIVRLGLQSTLIAAAPAWNVVGDLKGRDRPDEVVVLGGHLDSWDPGVGAIDDGAGVAITTAAAHLLASLPAGPRRTVRVVLWGSEEQSGSGAAYAAAHRTETSAMVLAGESDLGAGPIWSVSLPKGSLDLPPIRAFRAALPPLKVIVNKTPPEYGGSDIDDLTAAGVPFVDLNQDAGRYFDLHHTADDTLDKIQPQELAQNVAVWAALLLAVADSDVDFRRITP